MKTEDDRNVMMILLAKGITPTIILPTTMPYQIVKP